MSERAPYSRVYWTIRDDPRLEAVYPSDAHLATWLRLLLAADMAWPAPADVPASIRRSSLRALCDAGIIELLPSGLFRFHGLDTERGRRREAAQASAGRRSVSERGPSGERTPTQRHLDASLAETRRDETRGGARAREDTEPDDGPVAWLAAHGACLPPTGGGLHGRLVRLSERHGGAAVIEAFERLGSGLSDRQYVLGAENALEVIPKPNGKEQRDAEEQAAWKRKLEATQRRIAELRPVPPPDPTPHARAREARG